MRKRRIRSKKVVYKGTPFRSILEAKWAVFFDSLSIKWKFEPILTDVCCGPGLVTYMPDFYLSDLGLWVEVKPVDFHKLTDGEHRKIRGWARDFDQILILCGPPSIPREGSTRNYVVMWSERAGYVMEDKIWWCECLRCKKIGLEFEGGVPRECSESCYMDLFGEEIDLPEGHKSPRLKNACKKSRIYKF